MRAMRAGESSPANVSGPPSAVNNVDIRQDASRGPARANRRRAPPAQVCPGTEITPWERGGRCWAAACSLVCRAARCNCRSAARPSTFGRAAPCRSAPPARSRARRSTQGDHGRVACFEPSPATQDRWRPGQLARAKVSWMASQTSGSFDAAQTRRGLIERYRDLPFHPKPAAMGLLPVSPDRPNYFTSTCQRAGHNSKPSISRNSGPGTLI